MCLTSSCRMSSVVLVRNEQDFRGKPGPPLKDKLESPKRKIPGWPKEKSELPKKSRKGCSGEGKCWPFLEWACLQDFSQIVTEVFLFTKNGFCQTGPNAILWKSVKSTLIFLPQKISGILITICIDKQAQGNQLWTISHKLCYISAEKATYIVFIFSHKVCSSVSTACEANAMALKCEYVDGAWWHLRCGQVSVAKIGTGLLRPRQGDGTAVQVGRIRVKCSLWTSWTNQGKEEQLIGGHMSWACCAEIKK